MLFSIPCNNAFVETIFSHMNHLWSDYRNRIDTELVEAELQIRKNSNIPCAHFYKFILTDEELLRKIASNEKYIKKKRLLDKWTLVFSISVLNCMYVWIIYFHLLFLYQLYLFSKKMVSSGAIFDIFFLLLMKYM